MDFRSVIQQTNRYNFHSHTQYCDGRASMADFADAAVRQNFLHYGFSPHSPVPIVSPCNMSMRAVDEYLAETRRLQSLYADRIRFYASMEVDYLGAHWGPSQRYFRNLGLDYVIGSVHFIPSQRGKLVDIDGHFDSFRRKMAEEFDNDIEYVTNKFFDQSELMLRCGGFEMIGHIDKVAHNAACFRPGIDSEPWFEQRVERLIAMAVADGVVIEINTKAWSEHHRMFPDTKWFPLLNKLGAMTVVNSDAHYPDLIDASRSEAFRLLRDS